MSRLTIEVTEQQHQALKAKAALEGKSIKQYTLERLFPSAQGEDEALQALKALLAERIAEAERGELVEASIADVANDVLRRESRA
ncbi:antitoxin [Thauera butanivorans]|uniref:antitoxin n=1 Tax=Thauera butanivorans TaxID=86174 RepID=UPI003AB60DA0